MRSFPRLVEWLLWEAFPALATRVRVRFREQHLVRDRSLASWLRLLVECVFVPHEIHAVVTSDQEVQVAVTVHVDRSNVVGALIDIDHMWREMSNVIIMC